MVRGILNVSFVLSKFSSFYKILAGLLWKFRVFARMHPLVQIKRASRSMSSQVFHRFSMIAVFEK